MPKIVKKDREVKIVTIRLTGPMIAFFEEMRESEMADAEVVRKIIRTHPDYAKFLAPKSRRTSESATD